MNIFQHFFLISHFNRREVQQKCEIKHKSEVNLQMIAFNVI